MNPKKLGIQNATGLVLAIISGLAVVLVVFAIVGAIFWLALPQSDRTAVWSRGTESPYSQERQQISGLGTFDRVSAEVGQIQINYGGTPGAEPVVFVKAARYMDKLRVIDGTLFVRRVAGRNHTNSKNYDKLEITMPELVELSTHGNVRVAVDPGFGGNLLSVGSSGASSVELQQANYDNLALNMAGVGDFAAQDSQFGILELKLAGSGNLMLDNRAQEAEVKLQASGTVQAKLTGGSLAEAEVTASGVSDIELGRFLDGAEFRVTLTGSSKLSYSGSPKISKSLSGSSELEQMES